MLCFNLIRLCGILIVTRSVNEPSIICKRLMFGAQMDNVFFISERSSLFVSTGGRLIITSWFLHFGQSGRTLIKMSEPLLSWMGSRGIEKRLKRCVFGMRASNSEAEEAHSCGSPRARCLTFLFSVIVRTCRFQFVFSFLCYPDCEPMSTINCLLSLTISPSSNQLTSVANSSSV